MVLTFKRWLFENTEWDDRFDKEVNNSGWYGEGYQTLKHGKSPHFEALLEKVPKFSGIVHRAGSLHQHEIESLMAGNAKNIPGEDFSNLNKDHIVLHAHKSYGGTDPEPAEIMATAETQKPKVPIVWAAHVKNAPTLNRLINKHSGEIIPGETIAKKDSIYKIHKIEQRKLIDDDGNTHDGYYIHMEQK